MTGPQWYATSHRVNTRMNLDERRQQIRPLVEAQNRLHLQNRNREKGEVVTIMTDQEKGKYRIGTFDPLCNPLRCYRLYNLACSSCD